MAEAQEVEEMKEWQGICSWQAVGIQWYYLQGTYRTHQSGRLDTAGCAVLIRQGAYSG